MPRREVYVAIINLERSNSNWNATTLHWLISICFAANGHKESSKKLPKGYTDGYINNDEYMAV